MELERVVTKGRIAITLLALSALVLLSKGQDIRNSLIKSAVAKELPDRNTDIFYGWEPFTSYRTDAVRPILMDRCNSNREYKEHGRNVAYTAELHGVSTEVFCLDDETGINDTPAIINLTNRINDQNSSPIVILPWYEDGSVSTELKDLINAVYKHGGVFLTIAGNNNNHGDYIATSQLASIPRAVCVFGIDPSGKRHEGSRDCLNSLGKPIGAFHLTLDPEGNRLSGTSFAVAHLGAELAKFIELTGCEPAQAFDILREMLADNYPTIDGAPVLPYNFDVATLADNYLLELMGFTLGSCPAWVPEVYK